MSCSRRAHLLCHNGGGSARLACEHSVILLGKLRPNGCVNTALGLTTMQGYCTMAERHLPTPEELRQLLRYDPETGLLFWKARPLGMFSHTPNPARAYRTWNTRFSGAEAGWAKDGYINITLSGQKLRGHRVAWAVYHGEWPDDQIDHINGIRDDNRICNLRDVSPTVNCQNRHMDRRNKSGHTCVFKIRNRWRADVRLNGTVYRLGSFDCPKKASEAVRLKHAELGFTDRHGKLSDHDLIPSTAARQSP